MCWLSDVTRPIVKSLELLTLPSLECFVFDKILCNVASDPPTLTLVGLAVSGNQVLELETVGPHLLLCFAANGRHVAVLHLAGAAARPGLDAHTEGIIWKTGRKY